MRERHLFKREKNKIRQKPALLPLDRFPSRALLSLNLPHRRFFSKAHPVIQVWKLSGSVYYADAFRKMYRPWLSSSLQLSAKAAEIHGKKGYRRRNIKISLVKNYGAICKEKPAKGEAEGKESSRGKPIRKGKCRFLLDFIFPPPARFLSRNTITYSKYRNQ